MSKINYIFEKTNDMIEQNFNRLYQYECLECGAEIISEGYCSKDCSDASWL